MCHRDCKVANLESENPGQISRVCLKIGHPKIHGLIIMFHINKLATSGGKITNI